MVQTHQSKTHQQILCDSNLIWMEMLLSPTQYSATKQNRMFWLRSYFLTLMRFVPVVISAGVSPAHNGYQDAYYIYERMWQHYRNIRMISLMVLLLSANFLTAALLYPPITLQHRASLLHSFAVSTSGFHSVPPVRFSFHPIPKSPNSTHYSLNWWALTPPASGPIELVVISTQDLWRSGAGGSRPKLSLSHTHAQCQSASRACRVSLQLNTYQPLSVKQWVCQKLDRSQVCSVRTDTQTDRQ